MSATIVKDSEGSFIPATQRPDGSWRKARRVKDGYVPQEEVPLYESKGKQWANRQPKYPVGIDPEVIKKKELELAKKNNTMYSPIPGLIIDPNCDAKSKKKKKKKKTNNNTDPRDVNADDEGDEAVTAVVTPSSNKQTCQKQSSKQPSQQQKQEKSTKPSTDLSSNLPVSVVDPMKRIKNLKKKLREIEALEQKIANGDSKSLDKDQLEKVSRKSDVLSEILALELSLEDK